MGGIEILVPDIVDAVEVALVLQTAVALVVLAHRADVVAFAEQQLQCGLCADRAGAGCR